MKHALSALCVLATSSSAFAYGQILCGKSIVLTPTENGRVLIFGATESGKVYSGQLHASSRKVEADGTLTMSGDYRLQLGGSGDVTIMTQEALLNRTTDSGTAIVNGTHYECSKY